MYEIYGRGESHGSQFSTLVRGVSILLFADEISCILGIPNAGRDHYVKQE